MTWLTRSHPRCSSPRHGRRGNRCALDGRVSRPPRGRRCPPGPGRDRRACAVEDLARRARGECVAPARHRAILVESANPAITVSPRDHRGVKDPSGGIRDRPGTGTGGRAPTPGPPPAGYGPAPQIPPGGAESPRRPAWREGRCRESDRALIRRIEGTRALAQPRTRLVLGNFIPVVVRNTASRARLSRPISAPTHSGMAPPCRGSNGAKRRLLAAIRGA